MANCPGCYWADRDPKTRKQVVQTEPDFLAQNMKPGGDVPDVRVVKSCGAGAFFFKSFGAQSHNCKKFIDNKQAEAEDAAAAETRRAEWKHPTSRAGLPKTQNVLELIEVMAEKDNEAFDILFTVMGYPEKIGPFIEDLDDMNIRGPQIKIALEAAGDIEDLITLATERAKGLVTYVNENYENSAEERAVKEGAARYGHGPAKKRRKESAPRVMSLSKLKKVRQKPKVRLIRRRAD